MSGHVDIKRFAERWLSAWTGNDPNGLLRFYAPDAYYRDPGRPEGVRGHTLLLPYFLRLLNANPDWRWQVLEILPIDRGFVLKWRAEIPVGRTVVGEEGLDIVELTTEGKICRNEVYFDRYQWMKLLGK